MRIEWLEHRPPESLRDDPPRLFRVTDGLQMPSVGAAVTLGGERFQVRRVEINYDIGSVKAFVTRTSPQKLPV